MKKINFSILIKFAVLVFLLATFFLQYEFLFATRIVSVVFILTILMVEIKKDYFAAHKVAFILLNAVIMAALIGSILFDNSTVNTPANSRDFLIPVFVYTLMVIEYKDLYNQTSNENLS